MRSHPFCGCFFFSNIFPSSLCAQQLHTNTFRNSCLTCSVADFFFSALIIFWPLSILFFYRIFVVAVHSRRTTIYCGVCHNNSVSSLCNDWQTVRNILCSFLQFFWTALFFQQPYILFACELCCLYSIRESTVNFAHTKYETNNFPWENDPFLVNFMNA